MECQGKMPRAVKRKAESTDVHVCGGLPRSSVEVSVMGMERRTEQLISWSKSQLRVFDNTHAERGTTSTMWLKLTKGKGNNAWRNKEYL